MNEGEGESVRRSQRIREARAAQAAARERAAAARAAATAALEAERRRIEDEYVTALGDAAEAFVAAASTDGTPTATPSNPTPPGDGATETPSNPTPPGDGATETPSDPTPPIDGTTETPTEALVRVLTDALTARRPARGKEPKPIGMAVVFTNGEDIGTDSKATRAVDLMEWRQHAMAFIDEYPNAEPGSLVAQLTLALRGGPQSLVASARPRTPEQLIGLLFEAYLPPNSSLLATLELAALRIDDYRGTDTEAVRDFWRDFQERVRVAVLVREGDTRVPVKSRTQR